MKGTEGIIDKILSDARAQAKKTVESAEYERAMSEKATSDWADGYLLKERKILRRECDEVVERKLTLAKLDKRKLLLKAKQEVIGEIFERVLSRLNSLKKEECVNLIAKLLENNADEGDKIVLPSDGGIIEKDLKDLEIVARKKLKFAKEKGDFTGGVMLIGASCDKDLTFSALLKENEEKIVQKITAELFN